jgi:hypothetical protein
MRRLAFLALILIGLASSALGAAYFAYRGEPAAIPPTSGPNAVWAEHAWVGRAQDAAAYDRLADELRRHQISDIFFHVGPLESDGTIAPGRHPNATALTAALRRRLPELRIHAWIGQRERRGGGPLDLANPAVRANIVHSSAAFLDLGFIGIHYNIEPLFSGDPNLLALLDDTAAAIAPRGGLLSLATYEIEPFPGAAWLLRLLFPEAPLWSRDYYAAVFARVDQAAVMMYDTAMPSDWLFGTLVWWETRLLLDLVDDQTTLFMGVPSYDEGLWNFDPAAENMVSGLRGIRMAIADGDPARMTNFGVAVYARWTTDSGEWAAYRRLWLGQP